MKRGEFSSPVNDREAIDAICKRHGVADLYVFGSRCTEVAARVHGGPKAPPRSASDVDIAVLPLDLAKFGPRQRVSLTIELEDLLDVSRVDLAVLPEVDPFMALDIVRGELLYTDDPDRQARHELYILRRAGDLWALKQRRMQMILEEAAR